MTYVREQTSAELAAHIRSLKKMAGWFDPLADRLWQEVEALKAENDAARKDLQNLRTDNAQLIFALKQEQRSYLVLRAERDRLKAENEALRDYLTLRVSEMPRDRLRETFNAAYYGPRELGSDGEQCRAGVLAVIGAAMGQGEQP